MTEFNSYPIFVADQVLMADHLNEIVNYLDEQDRLTRNKLIGIGIVCGLELKVTSSQIKITKGCGVTSAGYLIVQDELNLSYYTPYELPADFFPKYKSVYENWHMWQLLSAEQSLEMEDVSPIDDNKAFMKDKIVVLLLEMKEKPLKNCVDTDCDDKGDKIEFAIKPLLVLKSDIDKFLKSHEESPHVIEPKPTVEPVLHDLQLRRFNVPVNQLTSADLVLNAFLELVTEPQLKRLAEVLNYCYVHYKPILFEEATNPFSNVFETLKDRLSAIKNTNPFFIQYYYDWVDDLIKAYYEFKSKVFDVQVMCCPDEDLFPLHLMLGEATKSTSIDIKTKYRHYFLYSPLFNQQKELLAEVQLLFRRMKLLIQNYVIPNPNTFANTLIRITPSKYLDRPLSDRCIPYYYNPLELYKSWSWSKTRKGNAKFNLSYNAIQYNNADAIINPLLYDIERFNFFRVEGHIGKSYAQALSNIIGQRDQFNLPFEVVALSTATVARFVAADDRECLFKDLESLYQVIIAELICKFGELACLIADVPYRFSYSVGTLAGMEVAGHAGHYVTENVSPANEINFNYAKSVSLEKSNVIASLLGLSFFEQPVYKRGDFLRKHCSIKKDTVGQVYLALVDQGHSFIKPAHTNNASISTVYAHLFYFLDCVENVMGASWPYQLKNFNPTTFNSRFDALTAETRFIADNTKGILEVAKELQLEDELRRFPALTHTCFDERLAALKKEYLKRYQEIQALTNFMNYFKAHPGMEHKAGVPKGGTFFLVYHENPPRRTKSPRDMITSHVPGMVRENVKYKEGILSATNISELIKEAAVKDTALLKNFQLALTKYLDICRDMDDDTKDEITDILVSIPPVLAPTKFRIPEYAVIADFYLPYLCCSDCAPITFVVPKVPDAILSIGITPTEFCNNDAASYNVTVSPEGGSLSASGGGVEQGTFVFKPKGLAEGVNTLKYTLPDGRSTSVDVKITAPARISFKYEIQKDGITVKFYTGGKLSNTAWDFGDGTTSNEQEPVHTYQFSEEEREFVVKLSVKEGPCFSTVEQRFRLKRPVLAEFNIIPKLFCSRDDRTYNFHTQPAPKSMKEITNDNKLIISRDAATGLISFSPIKQKLTETKDFNLSYHDILLAIRIVVPNADFVMKLTNIESVIMLNLRARNENADVYTWMIQQGDRQLNFSGPKVEVNYRATQLNPQQDLMITLTTRNEVPGVNCEDKKMFTITQRVFKIFLNKDEFDNNTVA
jgi:hypothetical protein